MTSSDIQREILLTLRHGEQHYIELADSIDQAPFRVRAELRSLKRLGAVSDHIDAAGTVWRLTPSGERLAWRMHDQQELRR